MALVALAGLEGVFQLFPWAYSAVKIVGALYDVFDVFGVASLETGR